MTFWLTILSLPGLLAGASPEQRAVAFLSREVPLWVEENRCFSCHNNGDAARALFEAGGRGYDVAGESIASTVEWLRHPDRWQDNGGGGPFDDAVLARIQFASATLAASERELVSEPGPLRAAAALVAADQHEDGSWHLDESASIGSPATYGRVLATATARRVLRAADPGRYSESLAAADRFLRGIEVKTVIAAAAVLIGLEASDDDEANAQRRRALGVLREGRAPSGGFGPYVTSRAEAFDTALVVLALAPLRDAPALLEGSVSPAELTSWIDAGRRYLLETQLADGSWVETTRPAGQQSYAQYISTTGWATLALLSTEED